MFANELNSQGLYLYGRIGAGRFFPSITMGDCVVKVGCWLVFSPSSPQRDNDGKAELASRPSFLGSWRESKDPDLNLGDDS